METFKLDLSKLTPVAEADRVKGNWYVVADKMSENRPLMLQFHHQNTDIDGFTWNYWFAIPPGLPGFPEAELPDEFELKAGEWDYTSIFRGTSTTPGVNAISIKRKPVTLPTITIPSGTKSDQVAELKRLLEELS